MSFTFIRIIGFTLAMSVMIGFILSFMPFSKGRKILALVLFLLTTYVFLQQTFYNYLSRYITLQDSTYGVDKVIAFAFDFIMSINLIHFVYFIPWILMVTVMKYLHHPANHFKLLPVMISFVLVLIFHVGSICLLFVNVSAQQLNNPYTVYQKVEHSSEAINQVGILRFMFRDVINFMMPSKQITIIAETPDDPEIPIIIETDYTRKINDDKWQALITAETNDEMLVIDNYLINQAINPKNEFTGIFKDKNLILIMVEAFDYMAIDQQLTPTLYKIANEGWLFDQFYSPQYSCATGQSEFSGLLGLIPEPAKCTVNNFSGNDYYGALFNLFNQADYYSSSYHNWTDQYYDRLSLHKNMYSDHYYNYDELPIKTIQGWQSDAELFELALPYFVDNDKFFSFIITSSTHFPYDVKSTLGDRYLNEIDAVHPDYPIEVKRYISKAMELDKGIAYMIEYFSDKDQLDDTVFVLYSDHHPLRMDTDNFENYSYQDIDRSTIYGKSKTPFIIYNSGVEPMLNHLPISPIDILPTLANLFDLDHDPRLYSGQDYFNDSDKLVYFSNGSWLNEDGYYDASLAKFIPYENNHDIDLEYLSDINVKVKNVFNIARLIYRNDYFHKRHEIVFPSLNTNN